MGLLDTSGRLLTTDTIRQKALRLDTQDGMENLFAFLSLAPGRNLVKNTPQVPTVLLAGFLARAEFVTDAEQERLEKLFVPLTDSLPTEWWADLIEFFWRQPGADRLASGAIVRYGEEFEGQKLDNPDQGFEAEYLFWLITRIQQKRILNSIAKAKEKIDFTREENDLMDRLYQAEWDWDFEEKPGDRTLVNQINQKMGFVWMVLPQEDELF